MAIERVALGDDTCLRVAGPSFGHVSLRLTFHRGHTACAPALGRAAWDMLARGTTRHDRVEWMEAVEDVGASIAFPLSRTSASVTIEALEVNLEAACELALDALCAPLDPSEELEDWVAETDEEVEATLLEPDGLMALEWMRAWWAEEAWRLPSVGRAADRAALRAAALEGARSVMGGAALTLGVAADDPERLHGLVRRVHARVRARFARDGATPAAAAPRAQAPGRYWLRGATSAQAALLGLGRAPSPDDARWPSLVLHAMAFGGGFAGPLLACIRGDAGLSYDASWSLLSARPEGRLEARFSPEGARIDDTIAAVEEAWAEAPIDDALVGMAKALLMGNHVAALETTESRMRHAVHLESMGLPHSRLWTLPNAVLETEAAAVRAAATCYGPGAAGWTWVATGPFAGAEVLSPRSGVGRPGA